MKKAICLFLSLTMSTGLMANKADCRDAVGLWLGKSSMKDPSLCELKYPELCDNASLAIGLRYLDDKNQFVADLYPQRGVGASLALQCNSGQLSTIEGDPKVPPQATITYHCDELNNCVVQYEDFRLKTKLVKMWQADTRI